MLLFPPLDWVELEPDPTCRSYFVLVPKERARDNFPNYASQLQAIFVRSKSTKILK